MGTSVSNYCRKTMRNIILMLVVASCIDKALQIDNFQSLSPSRNNVMTRAPPPKSSIADLPSGLWFGTAERPLSPSRNNVMTRAAPPKSSIVDLPSGLWFGPAERPTAARENSALLPSRSFNMNTSSTPRVFRTFDFPRRSIAPPRAQSFQQQPLTGSLRTPFNPPPFAAFPNNLSRSVKPVTEDVSQSSRFPLQSAPSSRPSFRFPTTPRLGELNLATPARPSFNLSMPGKPEIDASTQPSRPLFNAATSTRLPFNSSRSASPEIGSASLPPDFAGWRNGWRYQSRSLANEPPKLETDTQWWRQTIIYEILPYSFKDSNGDGVGDLKGITSTLDHFVELGVETLHLTPIYPTEFKDMGYDVMDYRNIDPTFGTMADFDELLYEMKKRNMKLVLDFVLNHSSDKHEWFKKSVQQIDPYTDYYVWKNAIGYDEMTGKPIPPNNWVSIFDGRPGSGWKWNSQREQFYLHQFLPEQVDLDLRNENVKDELKKIIKFWLDKGVAGFRLDAATCFMEDKYFRDNPPGRKSMQMGLEENFELIHDLRTYLDKYNNEHGGIERIFIAEAHGSATTMRKYYDRDGYNLTHFPYTFLLRDINDIITANGLYDMIDSWISRLPPNAVSTWMTQDHDDDRVGTRIHPLYMDILTTISMMLPGNVGVYYGQEIGLMNGRVRRDQIRDFSGNGSRDPARLIMQWDDTVSAGFSINPKTFLPPSPDYLSRNVKTQKQKKGSHYQLFKNLSYLRKSGTFKHGDFKSYVISRFIYIFTRSYKGKTLIVITNLYSPTKIIDLNEVIPNLPDTVSVAAVSENLASYYEHGTKIYGELSTQFISLEYSSVVLEGY